MKISSLLREDKGNGSVVMNITSYEQKLWEHLTTSGRYQKLEDDPSNKISKKVTKDIKNVSLDKNVKKMLTLTSTIVPCIYGLPKIHKQGMPIIPIVNTIGLPTHVLVKILMKKLKQLKR